ncbi:MAG TPA: endonuclease/exonuclease/phosphatase family protein, partial [Flavobacterium sp.]
MRIISYNVNGIRAAISKGFIDWLQHANPDVICLQEIKATEDQIPVDAIAKA